MTVQRRIHTEQGTRLLCFPPLYHPALFVGAMSKSKRPPSYLLDRPLYHSGNHSPTSSKGTIPDGDFRANEFLVRFLFQPLCTKATQNFTIGIPKLLYSGLNLLHQYLSLGKRTIIRDIPVNESYLLSFPLWKSPSQTDDR